MPSAFVTISCMDYAKYLCAVHVYIYEGMMLYLSCTPPSQNKCRFLFRADQIFLTLIRSVENINNIYISKQIYDENIFNGSLMMLIMHHKYKYFLIYIESKLKIFDFLKNENDTFY